jgi:hypothetical protein
VDGERHFEKTVDERVYSDPASGSVITATISEFKFGEEEEEEGTKKRRRNDKQAPKKRLKTNDQKKRTFHK